MKKSQAFPSNFLGKDDVTSPIVATISHVTTEPVSGDGGKEDKRVAHFRESHLKAFIINAGNWDAIAEIAGKDDDDEWGGTRIEIYVDPNVMFGGKRVGGVRVRRPNGSPVAGPPLPTGAPLLTPKQIAWAAWKNKNPHISGDTTALGATLTAAVAKVFPGAQVAQLTDDQWRQLVNQRFEPAAVDDVFAGPGIPAEDIPFGPSKF